MEINYHPSLNSAETSPSPHSKPLKILAHIIIEPLLTVTLFFVMAFVISMFGLNFKHIVFSNHEADSDFALWLKSILYMTTCIGFPWLISGIFQKSHRARLITLARWTIPMSFLIYLMASSAGHH